MYYVLDMHPDVQPEARAAVRVVRRVLSWGTRLTT